MKATCLSCTLDGPPDSSPHGLITHINCSCTQAHGGRYAHLPHSLNPEWTKSVTYRVTTLPCGLTSHLHLHDDGYKAHHPHAPPTHALRPIAVTLAHAPVLLTTTPHAACTAYTARLLHMVHLIMSHQVKLPSNPQPTCLLPRLQPRVFSHHLPVLAPCTSAAHHDPSR
ncbi:hypothetical protein AMTRI_Chr06g175880 [Amborella trichopoda]